MEREEFIKIFDETESNLSSVDGDSAYLGLQIIAKYTKNLIHCAEHDVIYSEDINTLCEAGITKEDVTQLRIMNWGIEGDSLYSFV